MINQVAPLTKDEAALVLSLLRLWDSAYEYGRHSRQCGCAFCEDIDEVGFHKSSVFDLLRERAIATKAHVDSAPQS